MRLIFSHNWELLFCVGLLNSYNIYKRVIILLSSPLGRLDFVPQCGGHGTFSMEVCGCVCEEGWTGKNCSEPRCPDDCSGQGICIEGECVCDQNFGGENCSEPRCPSDCSDRGLCIDGECVCEEAYAGEDCSQGRCLNDCSDQGTCVNGSCQCRPGFLGEDCSLIFCANNCSQKGVCKDGFCSCQEGYTGDDCASGRCLSRVIVLWWREVCFVLHYVVDRVKQNKSSTQVTVIQRNEELGKLLWNSCLLAKSYSFKAECVIFVTRDVTKCDWKK